MSNHVDRKYLPTSMRLTSPDIYYFIINHGSKIYINLII